MFVHNHIVRTRVLAVVLLVPAVFLGWVALQIMVTVRAGIFIGGLILAVDLFMIYGCWLTWKYADHIGNKTTLPDPSKWTGPNTIDRKTRIANVAASCFFLAYGIYSLVIDDFYLPAKRGGIHFSGVAAWLMFACVCCVLVNLISEVIDHYDRRNNELLYANAAAISVWFAWTFFAAAHIRWWFS